MVKLLHPSVQLTTFAAGLLLASMLMFLGGGYVGVLRQRTGARVPEAAWTYTPASLHAFLLRAREGGWHVYRVALWWDIVFSIVFALTGFVLVNGLWGRADASGLWLSAVRLLPILAGAVDIFEDALLLGAIGVTPVPASGSLPRAELAMRAQPVTRAKLLLYLVSVLAILGGGVALVADGRA